jgi:hypothetical protein
MDRKRKTVQGMRNGSWQDTAIAAGATDSVGTAAQVLKISSKELDNGNYLVEFKILTASVALQFRLRVMNRVVFVKTVSSVAHHQYDSMRMSWSSAHIF